MNVMLVDENIITEIIGKIFKKHNSIISTIIFDMLPFNIY